MYLPFFPATSPPGAEPGCDLGAIRSITTRPSIHLRYVLSEIHCGIVQQLFYDANYGNRLKVFDLEVGLIDDDWQYEYEFRLIQTNYTARMSLNRLYCVATMTLTERPQNHSYPPSQTPQSQSDKSRHGNPYLSQIRTCYWCSRI